MSEKVGANIPIEENHPDPSIVVSPKIPDPWSLDKILAVIADKPLENPNSPVPFFHLLERLKTPKREGWKRFGIKHGESVFDHSGRMAVMAMFAPTTLALDVTKCMKMSLIHDLAESLVGDITPADRVPKAEKSRRETIAVTYLTKQLLGNVGGGITGDEIYALWQEHEGSITPESKFVQDVDKVEMLLQMMEYERRGKGKIDLSEFTYVVTKLQLAETKVWAADILKERDEFWKENKATPLDKEGGLSSQLKELSDQYYGE